MAQHMLGSSIALDFVDKRRSGDADAQPDTDISIVVLDNAAATAIFTADKAGTITTLVGNNGVPATGVNVVRIGEEFSLFDSTGAKLEDTVFTVDAVAVDTPLAGDTTVTFSPAAAVATVAGDEAKLMETIRVLDETSLDNILQEADPAYFTASRLTLLTQNDKIMELRQRMDPGGVEP